MIQTLDKMANFYREQTIRLVAVFMLINVSLHGQLNVALQLNNPPCGGFATGSITAIPLSGQAPYTYLWSNGSTQNPLNNIPAGNYTVTVTDFDGVTGTATGMLNEPPPLYVEILVTDCGIPGEMEAGVSGGIMPFTYEWSTGETTPSISNLATGLYCLTVTDVNSCAFQTCESIGTPMALTIETDTAFCGDTLGGYAIVAVTGGVWPFEFEWETGETNDTITNLAPGNYDVTVTAENGCTIEGTGEVEIGPGDYDINFDNVNPGCSGSNTGSVTAIGEGGAEPYIFIWSTNDTAATVNDLPAGTYYVTATDDWGCVEEDSTELVTASSINLSISAEAPSCANGSDGMVSVSASNGAAPYTYLWSTGDSTESVPNLPAGTYIVFVTDTLNCIAIDSVSIADPPPLGVNVSTTNVSECGEEDGSAIATPSSIGTPPYSYVWSNGDTTNSINNLPVGVYYVTLTDANDCMARDSAVITGPSSLDVTIGGSSIVCFGENDGTLTVEVANGTPPFAYEWSTGANTETINNLGAGSYTVTVTSSEGCIGEATTDIENSPLILINPNIVNASCHGFSNGAIAVSLSGGTSPISLLWENGSNSTIRNSLSAGNYFLTVTDVVGCSIMDTFTVEQPDELLLSFNSSVGSCGNNGFTIAIATGGTMPYSYQWDTGATTAFIDGLAPGNYTVTVTDANNCSKVSTANIPLYPAINLNVTSTNTTCNGTTDGTATANTTGGNAPYSFLWSNGQTTQTISNLIPGNYEVTVTDATDCTTSGSAQVSLGDGLNVTINGTDFLCPGELGNLMANAAGGASSYNYLWSNGETSQTIINLTEGSYSVTATDPTGCTGEEAFTISSGGNYTVNTTFEHVDCYGESSGRIALSVINASAPILYFWSNGETTSSIENIPAGSYTVTVADASNCTQTLDFNIDEPPLLELEVIGTNGFCGNLGAATSILEGGTSPYFYQWSNGSTNPSISILGPGTYVLTVTDAKGCQAIDSAMIEVIPSISCDVMLIQPISSINGNNGILMAMTNDGVPPFNYEWSNGQNTETISNLGPGNYAVTIADSDNCVTTCNFFLMDGARIGDFVWADTNGNGIQDAGESGIQDVSIHLQGTDGYGNMVDEWVASDIQGAYNFDVIPGNYQLTFETPLGFLPSPNLQGGDPALDSDADPITNMTTVFSINGGFDNQSIDAGFVLEINCDNILEAGEICCDQSLCAPGEQPDEITNIVDPSGGSGALEYLWMSSDQPGPFDPLTWTVLPNSNSANYIPEALQTTTYFVRRTRRNGCSDFLESDPIEVVVNDFPEVEIIGTDTACIGEPAAFTANDFGSSAAYNWTFPNGSPNNGANISVNGITWDEPGVKNISLAVDIDGCVISGNSEIYITENPDICGFDLVLNGILTDSMTVLLDWLYPESNTVIRTYLVEYAFENDPFSALGPPDSTSQAGDLVHFFRQHQNPKIGKNNYRVILNDSEGNQLISNIVQIQKDSVIQTGDYYLVHSFPNPFSNKISIDVYDRFDGVPITVELINSIGQVIYFDEIPIDMDQYEINTSTIAAGTYFLLVRYDGRPQKVFKLIK